MIPNNRNCFATNSNSNNVGHPNDIPLPEQYRIIGAKIVDELDFFGTILVLDEKESKMRSDPNSVKYAAHLKEISIQKIGDLFMEIIPLFSSLPRQNALFLIEKIYVDCAQKWNSMNPVDHLRNIQYVEQWLGRCFGETQKRNFMHTHGINQPKIPLGQTQNNATHPPIITNATSAPNIPSQNYVQQRNPYLPPQQILPPQINSNQPMTTVFHPNQINSNVALWNGIQQSNSQQSPANCKPPPYTAQKRSYQESTIPMIATQSQPHVAQCERITNVKTTVGPYVMQPLFHSTPNTPPTTPISTELPILDVADVAGVLNEIPLKKARMKITSRKTANCGDNQIGILPDHARCEQSLAVRTCSSAIDDQSIQKMELPDKNQTQNEPRNLFADIPENNSNEKSGENVPVIETELMVENTVEDDGHPDHVITPKACAAEENETEFAKTANNDDDGDYVILVETCTKFIPKIEKIENAEEKQAREESLINKANSQNDRNETKSSEITNWYEDISSDSDA